MRLPLLCGTTETQTASKSVVARFISIYSGCRLKFVYATLDAWSLHTLVYWQACVGYRFEANLQIYNFFLYKLCLMCHEIRGDSSLPPSDIVSLQIAIYRYVLIYMKMESCNKIGFLCYSNLDHTNGMACCDVSFVDSSKNTNKLVLK